MFLWYFRLMSLCKIVSLKFGCPKEFTFRRHYAAHFRLHAAHFWQHVAHFRHRVAHSPGGRNGRLQGNLAVFSPIYRTAMESYKTTIRIFKKTHIMYVYLFLQSRMGHKSFTSTIINNKKMVY